MVIIGFSQKCAGGRHICKVTNQSKFTLSSGNDVFDCISYLEKDFFWQWSLKVSNRCSSGLMTTFIQHRIELHFVFLIKDKPVATCLSFAFKCLRSSLYAAIVFSTAVLKASNLPLPKCYYFHFNFY